jgi:hypothetical protein
LHRIAQAKRRVVAPSLENDPGGLPGLVELLVQATHVLLGLDPLAVDAADDVARLQAEPLGKAA